MVLNGRVTPAPLLPISYDVSPEGGDSKNTQPVPARRVMSSRRSSTCASGSIDRSVLARSLEICACHLLICHPFFAPSYSQVGSLYSYQSIRSADLHLLRRVAAHMGNVHSRIPYTQRKCIATCIVSRARTAVFGSRIEYPCVHFAYMLYSELTPPCVVASAYPRHSIFVRWQPGSMPVLYLFVALGLLVFRLGRTQLLTSCAVE